MTAKLKAGDTSLENSEACPCCRGDANVAARFHATFNYEAVTYEASLTRNTPKRSLLLDVRRLTDGGGAEVLMMERPHRLALLKPEALGREVAQKLGIPYDLRAWRGPRDPSELSHAELASVVREIQVILWQYAGEWTSAQDWSDETADYVSQVLDQHSLNLEHQESDHEDTEA